MTEPSLQKLFEKMFESKTISPNYKIPHIIHTLLLLGEDDYGIGRYRIRKELHLGEGSIKTMLSRLKDEYLIDVLPHKQQGHILTPLGKKYLEKIVDFMSYPHQLENTDNEFVIGNTAYYTIIPASKVKKDAVLGIPQRDEAIKIGAEGASVLIFNGKELVFSRPDDFPINIREIDLESLTKDDHILIGGGNSPSLAVLGVIAAAISLVTLT